MNKVQHHLINALVLVTVTTFALLAGFYAYSFKLLQGPVPELILSGDPLLQYDPETGFRATSNSKSVRTHPLIRLTYEQITDANGARISAESERGSSSFPVTVIGCSYTWGHGVSNDETYSRKVSKKLNSSVQNLGMNSYGSIQSLQMLKKLGGESKLIIYGFIDDHLRRNVTPCASTYGPYCLYVPTVRKNDNGDFYIDDNIPLDNVSASIDYFEWARRKDYVSFDNIRFGYLAVRDRIAAMLGRQMVTLPKDDWIPATEFVINEMGKIARRNGAKLLVVNVGIGSPAENFHYLSSRAWDENIAFLDASEFDIPNEELFLKGDGHPNAHGHSLIAERVATFVDRNKLLVHDKSTFNKTVSH